MTSAHGTRQEDSTTQETPVERSSGTVGFGEHHDAAMSWVVGALLDPDVSHTVGLLSAPAEQQLLALELLRTAARSALHVGGIDAPEFLAGLCRSWTAWIGPEHMPVSEVAGSCRPRSA